MADTRANANLTPEIWDDKFFTEYLTENRYSGEMGTNENNIIQVREDLSKKRGDRINFALVNKLSQQATTGRAMMEGNEEEIGTRSYELAVDKRRNAVRVAEIDEQFSAISLREAGKFTLKDWAMKDTERLISISLGIMGGVGIVTGTDPIQTDPVMEVWVHNGEKWSEKPWRKPLGQQKTFQKITINEMGHVTGHGARFRLRVSDPVDVAFMSNSTIDVVELAA